MDGEQFERLVVAFEKAARALGGIHGELKRAGKRYWPESGPKRESIVTRVLTEEEKRQEQRRKSDNLPIEDWLTNLRDPEDEEEPEGVVGERSRQWIKDHPPEESKETKKPDAGAKVAVSGEANGASTEAVEGEG